MFDNRVIVGQFRDGEVMLQEIPPSSPMGAFTVRSTNPKGVLKRFNSHIAARVSKRIGKSLLSSAVAAINMKMELADGAKATLRGDLPEMTGKAWLFVAIIVGVVLVFGPMALGIVKNALGGSTNTINNNFNITT